MKRGKLAKTASIMASQVPRTGQTGEEAGPLDQDAITHKPLHQLYDGFANMYKQAEESANLDDAIRELQDATKPTNGIQRAKILLRLAAALQERHRRKQSLPDRQGAAALLLESADQVPDDHLDKPEMLHRSAKAYIDIFQRGRSLDDLALARRQLREIVRVAKADDPMLVKVFRQLAVAHQWEYVATKDCTILDEVARCLASALKLTAKGHPQRHLALYEQGKAYSAKSDTTGEVAFLEVAARQFKHALDCVPKGDPLQVQCGALRFTEMARLVPRHKGNGESPDIDGLPRGISELPLSELCSSERDPTDDSQP
jgi:tetratricopeptide (TPR) repeat protein